VRHGNAVADLASYAGGMLDLDAIDVDDVATALAQPASSVSPIPGDPAFASVRDTAADERG
jgi:hypothetical protein